MSDRGVSGYGDPAQRRVEPGESFLQVLQGRFTVQGSTSSMNPKVRFGFGPVSR